MKPMFFKVQKYKIIRYGQLFIYKNVHISVFSQDMDTFIFCFFLCCRSWRWLFSSNFHTIMPCCLR